MSSMGIIGWSMLGRLESAFCEVALKIAILDQDPSRGLIHHADRGIPYSRGAYRRLPTLHGTAALISRKGVGLDNAPMASVL